MCDTSLVPRLFSQAGRRGMRLSTLWDRFVYLHTVTTTYPGIHTYLSFACRLQAILATHGIPTQTQRQVEPIKIRAPQDILMKVEDYSSTHASLSAY